ncbi:Lanthionine synthetase C-like protein [Bacteroides faecichinchillae]|uniref:Lanthionine synthetase C-like protein n=1 Tax=Bacteroides faecichinchillae TaxID=871325 RepID=A0A1M4ZAM3_9BACE|nr:lanthionine synthetase LanC family protein [Bacteroides faecichinchillae]SHF15091.1 Lanthionine synthetase C-like protein [Bacteroides faecichinchillae]
MKTLSRKLKEIIDNQILNGSFSTDQSLLNGRMGLSLFFFHCSRLLHNRFYEDFAGELLEDICLHLPFDLAVDFADGFCGIGWAVEYMRRQGFVEGDTDEILKEIDGKVMERDLRRTADTSFEHGLEGIVSYVRARLDSPRRESNELPFDTDYLEDLKNACQRTGVDWQSEDYIPEKVWKRVVDWWRQEAAIAEVYNWKRGIPLLETYQNT